jgi:4-hydroxy-3-polyprenylbenzoate decarboxylase
MPEKTKQNSKTITLAITGASGVQYGLRLLECLVGAGHSVYLMVSKAALMVIATETDLKLPSQPNKLNEIITQRFNAQPGQIKVFAKEDWTSPVASGSGAPGKMVICPCSTGTLSAIATGACDNLIERAADVVLKEKSQLILVPREAPYSTIHLQNMLTLSQMGATILPASPGFYHNPETIEDLIDFVVARILKQLAIEQNLVAAWGGC